jgi:catechol 2,3-dioxygenase-like lactoylglutathione lyase family enzyme
VRTRSTTASDRGQEAATAVEIDRIDHFVLTVRDVEAAIAFYARALGMRPVTFAGGRRALAFGRQKINLHDAGAEFEPKAQHPVPGSADFCLIADAPIDDVVAYLRACAVEIVEGPVPKSGAAGALISVYIRDPDGNLIEIANDLE